MIDLQPAADLVTALVRGVRDDQLDAPTPCADTTLAALLAHVGGLAEAFTAGARKAAHDSLPMLDPDGLGADWRERVPARLAELAEAWRDPAAWTGSATVGGVELPGAVMGMVAADELVVHGWDVAVASGQPFDCPLPLVEAALGFVAPQVEANPHGTPGLFGPAVPVPTDARPLDRLLALTGRDPAWRPVGAPLPG